MHAESSPRVHMKIYTVKIRLFILLSVTIRIVINVTQNSSENRELFRKVWSDGSVSRRGAVLVGLLGRLVRLLWCLVRLLGRLVRFLRGLI